MTWFAFIGYGHVFNLNGVAEKEMASTGAHGYATESDALQNPNAPLNGAQAALAQTFEAEASLPFGASTLGVLQVDQVNQPKGTGTGGVGQSPSQAQKDIQGQQQVGGGLLNSLTGALHWLGADTFLGRALKIVVGGVLLLAGVIKMTGAGRAIPYAAAAATKLPGVV